IIQISIDGIGDIYNEIRKDGNYELFLENVKKIVAATESSSTDVMFNIVVTKENYHQVSEIIDLAHDIGVKFVNLAPFNVSSTNHDISYYEFFQSGEFSDSYADAVSRAKQYSDSELTYWRCKRQGEGFRSCPSPWSNFYVTWDGYVVPCCVKPFPKELNFGNLNDSSLMECLNAESFRSFRKMWYENKTPDFCGKCQFVFL
ncbi:MAG TPA: SPASM domain-containing protein, partial [Candidatus Kryptobacter bacterium]|nr:SPASM domain-containing protein [Candidatus Kryptobacter bacterium]